MSDKEQMMRLPAVLQMIGLGRTFWLDAIKAGSAPSPYKMGSASLWKSSEVQSWLDARLNGRPYTPPRSFSDSQRQAPAPRQAAPKKALRDGAAMERISTAVLAALVARSEGDVGAGMQGQVFAETACDFAAALLRQLETRAA